MILSVLLLTVAAQAAPDQKVSPQKTPDVVVEGQRDIPRRPENPRTTLLPGTPAGMANRKIYDNALRVAECMMRQPRAYIRMAIDGAINTQPQRRAMSDLIERTALCNSNPNIVRQARFVTAGGSAMTMAIGSGFFADNGSQTDLSLAGVSIYDRGALIEQVIAVFAPNLALTRRQTHDRAVQQRFDALEVPRNRQRTDLDFRYFATVVCMVRMEPALAVAMLKAPSGSVDQSRAQANIIDRARPCVGNAQKVKVDSVQFRAYVADAVYRWAVAANGVDTLIPAT